ncbi:sulfatase [Chlorella sorokiniana]|uniref:Sulfatase n=1 Tax=Chlorella sorokiniana TaxID=3076 RepID=A0A2P6TJ70_CHLSO|nr:sulfatase [Chlorella sorokiniana]|eukprot:PRW39288.1 sulfatase [Chlorella sorokiniana]
MGGDWWQPGLRKHLADEGLNFTNYITNFAVCCPSRATILAGQCAHNTGVVGLGGDRGMLNPLGGFQRFVDMGLEERTGAYVLQQSGYRTGLTAWHVPKGWDRWFAFGEIDYYNYTISDHGANKWFGTEPEDYSTDVLTAEAVRFIEQAREDDRPFFLYLAPYACHRPHIPAPRHIGKYKGLRIPRVPSWNASEQHTRQKVSFMRDLPPVDHETADALDFEYQTRAETLLAVDDMIEAVINALRQLGELDNTYIFYTADNGYKLGHHRLSGKITAYENDIRLPFFARGPGVPRGLVLPHLVGNVDLAPTWLDVAGVKDPYAAQRDGISLGPLLRGETAALEAPDTHRVGILIEKPVTTAFLDMHVSILVPEARPGAPDLFEGRRPRRLANGSWPQQVLDFEFQSRHFNERAAARLSDKSAWYYGYEKEAGFKKYIELALENGISLEGLIKGSNEEFPVAYYGLRTYSKSGAYKLIQYPNGYELYDLMTDPHEVHNIYSTAPRELVTELETTLAGLKDCKGPSCRVRSINAVSTNPLRR